MDLSDKRFLRYVAGPDRIPTIEALPTQPKPDFRGIMVRGGKFCDFNAAVAEAKRISRETGLALLATPQTGGKHVRVIDGKRVSGRFTVDSRASALAGA